jgi:hypothetical protein
LSFWFNSSDRQVVVWLKDIPGSCL